ncbi:bifunctional glycosyltransferase/CDP-glycerol:glycerophosphate glycerophosphotransferase [Spirillospora sp. NBC_01491]|uniref:bifunctional glycosyltransferase/CDP-glycerol:glycerophosphate glycerophosphotransferase n=1 Tax=Spirillospora sp. NBC_01491 TaxID=2976007 RepID=UPI002E3429A5|nr:CDP-glycerol glycerophosphotransferase family protein [Spirillospora sp. NBC_01491]
MRARPDVSVVVIAYNDALRLPRAVGSVLGQSLGGVETVIVDDASTDGTGEIADRFAAGLPGRIRAVHLPANSGGCGRPRNVGIEHASGRFLMFLDSDDTLDRHACLNLVAAAEDTGADLVSGLCARIHLDRATKRVRPWYPWLYERRAVYGSLPENPDLLYDTLSTNKAYRRGFLEDQGLRFVERLNYEDLLFTAEAYLAAGRTALIPHRVYNWLVERRAGEQSITNRRAELTNFADRLAIHRRIDALFRRNGAADLKLAKDAKFVNHDLLLYLRELRNRDPGHQSRVLDLAAGYLADLDPRVFDTANAMPAIAAYLVREGDHAGALAAAEYGRSRKHEIRADLVELDGRVYWGGTMPDPSGHPVLDVTGLGFHLRPLNELRPANTVTALELRGGRAHLAGHVMNPLGRVPPGARLTGSLELYDRRRPGRAARARARVARVGDRLEWTADFDPVRRVRPLGFADPVWDTRLRIRVDGQEMVTRPGDGTGSPPLDGVALPVRPRLTRLAADRLSSYVTEAGHLAFTLDGGGRRARTTRALVHRAAASAVGRRGWARVRRSALAARRAATARTTKTTVFNRVLTRLPVRAGSAVFESHLGRHYAGNPKYIYRELRRSGRPVRAVWSHSAGTRGFPSGARLVRRGSWAYYLALARAEFWIDDQGFPDRLRKRRGTTYIQTWHGSAFKPMGFDQPKIKGGTPAEQARLRRMVGRYDCFLIRSRHDAGTLAKGLGVRAELLPAGYPRNDPLVTGARGDPELAAEVAALRRALRLDDGRRAVLYAPTFRHGAGGRPATGPGLPIDPVRFARDLGEDLVLLVRPHYLTRIDVPPGALDAIRDAGGVPDVTLLLLIADALITDHSSIMFDYALLDRPMVFHLPDEADLGTGYFDLARYAPGPITRTEDELVAALAGLDAGGAAHAGRRRDFVRRFGEHDRGTAARTVVDRYFPERRTPQRHFPGRGERGRTA